MFWWATANLTHNPLSQAGSGTSEASECSDARDKVVDQGAAWAMLEIKQEQRLISSRRQDAASS